MENVNRDGRGYVDFEKMVGLDGIVLINIVSNAEDATVSGRKKLQTRITHNDGVIIFYFFSMVIQSKYMIRRYMVACYACYD